MGIGATGAYAGYNSVLQAATKDFNYRAANDGQNMDPTMIDTEQKSAITRQSGETLRMAKDIVNIRNEKQDSFVRSNADRVEEHMAVMTEKAAKARADRSEAKADARDEAKSEPDIVAEHMETMANRKDPIAEHMKAMIEKADAEARTTKANGPEAEDVTDKEPDILAAHRNTMLENPENTKKVHEMPRPHDEMRLERLQEVKKKGNEKLDYYERRSQEIRDRYSEGMKEAKRGPGKSMDHSV